MWSVKSSPFVARSATIDLKRFKNALHKVDEIRKEIQSNFQGDVPLRFKRPSKDYSVLCMVA